MARITAEQLRGARNMLRMQQKELSRLSRVSVPTLKRFESGTGPVRGSYDAVAAVVEVLEGEGITFEAHTGTFGSVCLDIRQATLEFDDEADD